MQWVAGPQGGGWFAMAEGLARLINEDHPELGLKVAAGGGKENPGSLQRGEAELGMSIDILVAAAHAGKPPYEAPMCKIATLGAGWSSLPFHLVRAADAEPDLRAAIAGPSLRIAVPAKDTSDEITFRRVMEFLGTSYDRVRRNGGLVIHGSYDEIAAALKDGKVDYLFGATTRPAAIMAGIGEGPRPMALTAMPAELIASLTRTYGYGRGVIPADTHPKLQSDDIATCVIETIFMISSEIADNTAYGIARTLLTRRAELAAIHTSMAGFDPVTAWRNLPAPLNPGAARAYRELGFMA